MLVVAFRLSVVTSRPVHALSAVAVALPVSTLAFPRPHGPRSNSPRAKLSPYRPGGLRSLMNFLYVNRISIQAFIGLDLT